MKITPVSSFPYTSLSAKYLHDQYVNFEPYYQQYDNGYYVFKHDIFREVEDLSFNKYTGFYITEKVKQSDIIADKKIEQDELFTDSFVQLYMKSIASFVSFNETDKILYADKYNTKDATTFQVISNPDNTITFYYNKTSLIICESVTPWRLKLVDIETKNSLQEGSYKFKYEKHNGSYLIYTTYGVSGASKRYLKSSKNELFVGFFGTTLNDSDIQIDFNFIDYNYVPSLLLNGSDEQSWYYKYHNKPLDFQNNINVAPNFNTSISGVQQNFLVTIPYETKISDSSMNLDILSLKNIKNPNYKYSKLPYNLDDDDNFDEVNDSSEQSSINKRQYSKIFTGTNQEHGYEMPLLSYMSNNKSIEFLKDNTTFFHYPSSAPIVKLCESGLKEAGAVPSTVPFYADKVFKKDTEYGKTTHWGESTQLRNGQWLCSWLSGNNEDSVWVDRWYNPQVITTFAALNTYLPENIVCGSVQASALGISVVDVPTSLTFEPQVWYKYFHVGEKFINYIVDEVIDYKKQYLKTHFNNWQLSSIQDTTVNGNNGTFEGYTALIQNNLNDTVDNVAVLDGKTQYISIPYSDTIKVSGSNSFSIWAYSDNWETLKNCEIVSNGQNNYYNLRVTNGLETPISVIYANDVNRLMFFNSNQKPYAYVSLPNGNQKPIINSVCLDTSLNVWSLDVANNYFYKISYTGVIENKLEFPSTMKFAPISLGDNNVVYLLDTNSGNVSGFNADLSCVFVSSTNFTSNDYKISFNSNNNMFGVEATKFEFDNTDYPWFLSVDKKTIYRHDFNVVEKSSEIADFTIDSSGYVFVLFNNEVHKLDSVGNFLLSATLPSTTAYTDSGNIMVMNDYYYKTEKDENYIVVKKNNKFYKFNNNLEFISKNSISIIPNEKNYIGFYSDCNGYNNKRKFSYKHDFNGLTNLQLNFKLFSNAFGIEEYTLYAPINRLYKGWHHFTGVFNREESKIYFYIDGVLEDRQATVSPLSEMYRSLKNSMYLGAKMGTIDSFNKELYLENNYLFKGMVDDFRVYNKALNFTDVQNLFKLKQKFENIDWHIPTGFRCYVEEIQKFFKHKAPGSKSNHYNLNIVGLKITDSAIREQIEEIIRTTVLKITPANTHLYKVNWIEES